MKEVVVFLFICFSGNYLRSQAIDTEAIYRESIENQLSFENKSNKMKEMGVLLVDPRFRSMEFEDDNLTLMILTDHQLKAKSRKGLDYIEVYPVKIAGDQLVVEIMSAYKKKRKITFYGKSSYVFEFDCNSRQYVLVNKDQNIN